MPALQIARLVSAHSCAWVDPTMVILASAQTVCTSNYSPTVAKSAFALMVKSLSLTDPAPAVFYSLLFVYFSIRILFNYICLGLQ